MIDLKVVYACIIFYIFHYIFYKSVQKRFDGRLCYISYPVFNISFQPLGVTVYLQYQA